MSNARFFALIGTIYIAPNTNEAVAIISAVFLLIFSLALYFTDNKS